jgi:anti-sigma regulatory factor (Ser/Thr protein kinase)
MVSCITISRCHRVGEEASGILHATLAAAFEFAGQQALRAKSTRRLAIIVEEIVTNVLCHAGADRDITLTLRLEQTEAGLFVALEHDGIPFDPRLAPPRELPNPDRGGGVGLALVKAWAEIVCYDCQGQHNRLVLRLHPCPDAIGDGAA